MHVLIGLFLVAAFAPDDFWHKFHRAPRISNKSAARPATVLLNAATLPWVALFLALAGAVLAGYWIAS